MFTETSKTTFKLNVIYTIERNEFGDQRHRLKSSLSYISDYLATYL